MGMYSGLAKGGDSIFMHLAAKYGVGRQIHIAPYHTSVMEQH